MLLSLATVLWWLGNLLDNKMAVIIKWRLCGKVQRWYLASGATELDRYTPHLEV